MTTGTIHDLGYKRYAGPRRPPATRWRVIMREQLASAWKTWWRFKSAAGLAVVITFIAGGFLYLASDRLLHALGHNGLVTTIADGVVPLSITWYCRAAFVVSLTISAGIVAGDLQSGAFTFYFARSVRPRDYVLGKLAGLAVLMLVITVAGPLLLAALHLGLAESTDQLVADLTILPKILAIGALTTITYAAVPLGFSALVSSRRYALALWAVYYLVVGVMAVGIGMVGNGAVAALDLPTAIETVTTSLFDVQFLRGAHPDVPLAAALVSIGVQVTAAIVVVTLRVRAAQQSGVGGA